MHLEDKLAFVKNYLHDEHSLLFKNSHHPNIDENSLLKTCFYHIKSLNQSMQNHQTQVVKKQNQPCELPKIPQKPLSNNTKKSSSANLLPKNSLLLSKLVSESGFRASTSNLLKIPNSVFLRNPQTCKKIQGETKMRKKHQFKNLYQKAVGLSKEQRFYENQKVNLQGSVVEKLGFYEASNIYKGKNLQGQLREMKVIASKPEFNPIMMTNKDDLFLTNIQGQSLNFCVEEFIEKELIKEKLCQQVIHQCNSLRVSKDGINQQVQQTVESYHERTQIQESDLYITIKDYCFVHDESFKLFKAKQISSWGDILLAYRRIIECMKYQRISFLKVKSDKFNLWGGKKVSMREMAKILGLQLIEKTFIKIQKICIGFLDRLKVRRIKEQIKRKESLARWVCERFKTFTYLRKQRRQKKAKAYSIYNELLKNMQWDTQIYLPSFSMNEFKRNTTQYMQSFQNLYHAMWKDSSKNLILILPTLNENIIKILQSRIRVKRSLTIICPQIHQCFPINLSLSSQILFSYETLRKIEKAIDGKKAVIIPGCYQNDLKLDNQLLLSEYLNVPLLCSLEINNNYSAQTDFFRTIDIANEHQCIIQPNTNLNTILDQFCDLLMEKPSDKVWVIKLQGEFKGRGIATIKMNPLKYFKQEYSSNQNKALIAEYLKANFKLKIKINFQNSLYVVDHFLKLLQTKGGLIQQQINAISTYEICLTKYAMSQLQYLYKLYGTDYCNKIWVSTEPNGEMEELISAIQSQLDSSNYVGNINITVCKGANNRLYGIDIKLHQTYASSMIDFIGMIEERRAYHHQEAPSINSLPTKRPLPSEIASLPELTLHNYTYLVIPHLVFTDIEEEVKAKLIEEMMRECWNDRHVKLHEEGRVFLSMGVDFSIVLFGKDLKRLKKRAIDSVRQLNDRTSSYRKYRGKQVVRDVFHYGDIIRALSQIKQ